MHGKKQKDFRERIAHEAYIRSSGRRHTGKVLLIALSKKRCANSVRFATFHTK